MLLTRTTKKIDYKSAAIAKYAFVSYFAFMLFFSTGTPFTDRISEIDELTTSSTVNQIFISVVLLISSIVLISRKEGLFNLLKEERFLFLFLIWCLISIMWSDYRFVSFKRYIKIITSVSVCLAFLLYYNSGNELLKVLKTVLFIYVTFSLLAIIFIPGAIDSESMAWRGFTTQKNQLGQASLVSAVIWFASMGSKSNGFKQKLFHLFMILLSVILVLGSKSMTSSMVMTLIAISWIVINIDKRLKTIGIGRLFSFMAIFALIAIMGTVIYLGPGVISSTLEIFGKDLSFTGRTFLWNYIFEQAKKHLLLGCGFEGFWVVDSSNANLMTLYETFYTLVSQAHMGYLDLLNETGIIGIILLFLMIIVYYKNSLKLKKGLFWKWILLMVLVMNITESSLFRSNSLLGLMFIFSYLILYVELLNKENAVL